MSPLLTFLALSYNSLQGSFPSSFALPYLQYLDLSFNSLTGTLPDTINSLVSLNIVFMSHNSFHGTIPRSIGDVTTIIVLQLSYNCFSGTIPSTIGLLTGLGDMEIESNVFNGSVPDSFCNLTTLNTVYICDNNVDSTGCPFLSSVPNCIYEFPYDKQIGTLTAAPTSVHTGLPSPTPTLVPSSLMQTASPSFTLLGMSTCFCN